ncbi:hypothetical protein [Canibacter zhoujuaniae]|uniref:hypothetical protein n=1 Tax=Canibacter zhoujuaniae TaxID=2708343 RepID=UPI00141ECD6A|nr:hypothetical protein [Canibacter zhoujuaniae]
MQKDAVLEAGASHSRSLILGFCRGTAPAKWVRRWQQAEYPIPLEPHPLDLDVYSPDAVFSDEQTLTLTEVLNRGGVALVRAPETLPPSEHTLGELQAVRLYTEANAVLTATDSLFAILSGVTTIAELQDARLLDHKLHRNDWPIAEPWHDASWLPVDAAALAELVATGVGEAVLPLPLARNVANKKQHKVVPINSAIKISSYAIFAVWLSKHNRATVQDLIGVLRGRGTASARDTSRPSTNSQESPAQIAADAHEAQRKTGGQRRRKQQPPPNSRGAQLASSKNRGHRSNHSPRSARRKKRR